MQLTSSFLIFGSFKTKFNLWNWEVPLQIVFEIDIQEDLWVNRTTLKLEVWSFPVLIQIGGTKWFEGEY